MTFKNPEFSSNSPYYDDFDDTKNFLKILFKPGYAVQARELTQLQTILQSQVAKFADSIFQDGSQVFGGKIQITSTPYIRVEKFTHDVLAVTADAADTYLDTLPSNLLKVYSKVNGVFTELATVKVSYFETSNYSTNDNYPIVFYSIVSIAEDQNGIFDMAREYYLGLSQFGPFIKVINPSVEETSPVQYTISPFGNGYLVTVDEAIFYIDGYFVKTEKQTISLYKKSIDEESESTADTSLSYAWADSGIRLFNKPSHRIGYTVSRDVVTATQDYTLKDPARGFYNFNAPGADRYTINLTLTALEYDNQSLDIENYNSADFIQILRTTKGIVDYIKDKSSYSQILDLFAKRTEDESGSYTVKPFIGDVKNHLRKDKYTLTLNSDDVAFYFANNTVSLKVGGYIWPTTQSTFNPFTAVTFEGLSFPVAKVVGVLPDYDTVTGLKSLKIVVELQNNQRLSASTNSSYFFKQTSSENIRAIVAKTTEVAIDPKGAYSLLDSPQGNINKLAINLQPGKAYVFGYEYETFAPRVIDYLIDGNQSSTTTYSDLNVNFQLGNYIYGSFAPRNANQTSDVDFEKLPLMDLVDVDTNTILIYPNATSQIKSKILAWAAFKASGDSTIGNMVDMAKLYNADVLALFPHESVIFVENID